MSAQPDTTQDRTPPGFWVGLVLGAPVVAYGVRGLLDALPGVQLRSFIVFFAGGAIVHDLVIGPVVVGIGWLVSRKLPRPAVAPVQSALIVSAIVGLVSWPFVRGYGITRGEASFLPRDYTASVLTVWALVWAVALVVIAGRLLAARRSALGAGDRPDA